MKRYTKLQIVYYIVRFTYSSFQQKLFGVMCTIINALHADIFEILVNMLADLYILLNIFLIREKTEF